jgi:hypothetical protein
MPSIEKVKSVFSASIMAKDVLKLYYELVEEQVRQEPAVVS